VPNVGLTAEIRLGGVLENEAAVRNSQSRSSVGRPRNVVDGAFDVARVLEHVEAARGHWLVLHEFLVRLEVRLVNVQRVVLQNAVLHHLRNQIQINIFKISFKNKTVVTTNK